MRSALPINAPASDMAVTIQRVAYAHVIGRVFVVTVCVATAVAIIVSHNHHFASPSPRWLRALEESRGLKFTIQAKATSNVLVGTTMHGVLLPRASFNNQDDVLPFDGRVSYTMGEELINMTVIDGRGYATMQDLATGALRQCGCMDRTSLPSVHILRDAIKYARVVDDATAVGVECTVHERAVEFRFANEPYVICLASSAEAEFSENSTIHGQDMTTTIQMLTSGDDDEETEDDDTPLPALTALAPPDALDLDSCSLLDGGEQQSVLKSILHVHRRMTTHMAGLISVLSGQSRRLETSTSCNASCPNGKKVCLFLHGQGRTQEFSVTDAYEPAWGQVQTKLHCCSKSKFVRYDSMRTPWHDANLSHRVCNAAVALSGSTNPMHLDGIAVFTHSMGNLVMAHAAAEGICAIGASSTWISMAAPMTGSPAANLAVHVCNDNTKSILDDPLIALLTSIDICPAQESIYSLVSQGSKGSDKALDSKFERAQDTHARYVTSSICGTSAAGLLGTKDSIAFGAVGMAADFPSDNENDGAVGITSCQSQLVSAEYATTWSGGAYFKAAVNHGDITGRNGDGMWGDDRKPIKWLQCQV